MQVEHAAFVAAAAFLFVVAVGAVALMGALAAVVQSAVP